MMFSIVLVIKKKTYDETSNFDRFTQIGMMTYKKYLDLKSVKDFFVITPENEQKELQTMLTTQWAQCPWKFISDDKLIHKNIQQGWARQQTAKLAISSLVTTDHYLIVDDDTYLTRPFGYPDLFDETGKIIMNKTLIDFPFFFLWSNQVLKYNFENVQNQDYHMAITPEVFVTNEVRNLVRFLVTNYGNSQAWQLFLADHKYTEYCMYWIWLIKNNMHTKLYSPTKSVYGSETTHPDHNLEANIAASFDKNASWYFSFVQTSIGHKLDTIRQLVEKNMTVK
jgi:Family of unknown function (DUF6492)